MFEDGVRVVEPEEGAEESHQDARDDDVDPHLVLKQVQSEAQRGVEDEVGADLHAC